MALLSTASHGQSIPTGQTEFTEYVAAQLRREITGTAITVKGSLTIMVGDMQANLDRIHVYCQKSPDGCEREVTTYVKASAQVLKDRSQPPSRESVRLVVRSEGYLKASQAALPKGAPQLKARVLAGGLVMLAAIDTPRAIRMFNDTDGRALGLSTDEVFALGRANLQKQLKPLMEVARVAQIGQIGNLRGDVYHSSRLALHASWAPPAAAHGGKLIVSAPATDTILYVGADGPIAIDALRALTDRVAGQVPNRLSNVLLRWTPKRWEVVP